MPKYRILAERTVVEAWSYIVEAEDESQAIEMVEECPDGECESITRLQDDNCYADDTTFEVIEEIKEPKKKRNVRKKSR